MRRGHVPAHALWLACSGNSPHAVFQQGQEQLTLDTAAHCAKVHVWTFPQPLGFFCLSDLAIRSSQHSTKAKHAALPYSAFQVSLLPVQRQCTLFRALCLRPLIMYLEIC